MWRTTVKDRYFPALTALGFCLALGGCASSTSSQVQVVDRGQAQSRAQLVSRQPVTSGAYVVRPGDTLYSIAFRFGWDWKKLAIHNSISDPSLIKVGQVIRFDNRPVAVSAQPVTRPVQPTTPVVIPASTNRSSASVSSSSSKPVQAVSAPVVSTTKVPTGSATGWIWPSEGSVISRFSSNGSLNKGIDIAGNLGQSVLAASDGTVVYAGSGLRGYGELVIIKHSDVYVSAYGHNRRLLVQEGQKVKAGQRIAEMGSSGADRVKLHFEIRRQGKPVDPLQYLPRR